MNPLLIPQYSTPFGTIPFPEIKSEHFMPALEAAIEQAKAEIEHIKTNKAVPDFANTIEALEYAGELVGRVSTVFFNLHSAETNDELQQIARDFSPRITEFHNDILLDEAIFGKVKQVYDRKSELSLNTEQEMLLTKTYKGFARNGANLDEKGKEKLREISKRKSMLAVEFGDHVLAETNAFELVIENENDLSGLPEGIIEMAAQAASEKGKEGQWVFTLDYPSYIPFMTYADNRELREKMYRAFTSKAFKGNENDNQEIVKEIARLRFEKAQLLGYETHAHFVLEERMAKSPQTVEEFLAELLEKARPVANVQLNELTTYAKEKFGLDPDDFQRWDFAYYSEKLKMERFAIDDELLKPYFQLEKVIDGIFEVANRLYGISFKPNAEIPVYHPDVKAYEVLDADGSHLSVFYADFFPRKGKRAGAWMTSFRSQYWKEGEEIRPHVSIVCNFTKPTASKPSLLTLDEVLTFFHEFGHALHGMLAKGTYGSLTGTSVYWDFVELPSQIFENWVYEKECLDLFARHYQTGEAIPQEYIEKIKASSIFMEGYQTLRQISFGLLDMAWHGEAGVHVTDVGQFEREAMEETELFPPVKGSNMSCAFSHIFQGGYAAGYYSYKWAEVLDADAFEAFKEKGIFDKETAGKFREHILSAGGREHPMTLYKRFRGKEPRPDALLRRAGLL